MTTTARRRPGVPKIVQPRRAPHEVPWTPPFQYDCSRGHTVQAEQECCGPCPVCVDGEPCDGELARYGTGSRGPRT